MQADLKPYYEWYSNWIDWETVTPEDIYEGRKVNNRFSLLDDWLELTSLKVDDSIVGKQVFFSVNAGYKDTLTYDTYHQGCTIIKGIVEEIHTDTIKIDGKTYVLPTYTRGLFYSCPEYCCLCMHYDGEEVIELDRDGNIGFISLFDPSLITYNY